MKQWTQWTKEKERGYENGRKLVGVGGVSSGWAGTVFEWNLE